MKVPEEFQSYDCADYFAECWADRGHFDDYSQLWVIVPLSETYESKEIAFFAVGCSGADCIDFGYRVGHVGLWAYYPIGREFKFMARTIAELVDGYCSGKLHV
jgi:hypothetical protein